MFLNRPIANTVSIVVIFALGIISLRSLPVSLLPELQNPSLLISVTWPGVGAHELEEVVGEQMEAQLATISEVTDIQTIFKRGRILISLRFGWDTNMDIAFLNTREKIEQLRNTLPEGVERPQLIRTNLSDEPIAVLTVSAKVKSNFKDGNVHVKRWAEQVLARRLEQLDGVAQALVTGGPSMELKIRYKPERLERYGLTIQQLQSAISDANLFAASGEFRDGWYQYSVTIDSRLSSLDEIRSLPISIPDSPSGIVKLSDVAEIEHGLQVPDSFARLDDQSIITVFVKKRFGKNTVSVIESIEPILKDLNNSQTGIEAHILYQQADLIQKTITNLLQTLLLGGILSIVMLFFFLKDRRLPFVIGIAIPTSVMLTFFIMYLFDIQISIISLSGLTLGVGLLVDNAIIVIENISKHYKNGLSLIQLAGEGTKEIALPVTASTLTTISVFLPLLFLGGFEGVFFRDQAFTLSVSLLASLFVALVLIPGIVVGIKKEGTSISQNEHFDDSPRPKWLYNLYEKVLVWLLKKRWPAAIIFLLGLAIMFVSFGKIPKEIIPEVPPDRVGITFTLPANSSLQTAEFAAIHLQQELAALGFTEGVLLLGGFTDQASIQKLANQQVNRFTLSMPTPNASKRKTIQQWMNKMVLEQPEWHIDLEVSETDLRNILNYDEAPLMITWVNEERQDFMPWLKVYQLFLKENNISIVFKPLYNRTEKTLLIRPNESKMLDYGVSVRDFEAVLSASSDGLRTGTWFHEDEEQPIRLFQLNKNEQDLPVIRKNGAILPLSLFAVVDTVSQPEVLERRGQTPVWRLTSEILLSDAWSKVEKINQLNREFSRRSGIELQTGGIVTQLAVFLREMQWLLILSVGLIYIILAIQYESLIYPGIILISVPFAWLGAVLMLLVFNVSLNVFSFLGILILTGIAVNDAILKVDFMKRYVEQFGNPQKGILLAGKNRFRPVLMTTATTVIGLIPLIIPIGEGLAYRQSLGLTLIGGMVTSTFLTLLIIPILFDSLHALKKQMSTPKKIKTSDAKH